MAERTVVEIRADLTFYRNSKAEWQKAFNAIANGGQSYEMRDGDTTRVLTRANLPEVRKTLLWVDSKIADLEAELAAAAGQPNRRSRVAYFRGA